MLPADPPAYREIEVDVEQVEVLGDTRFHVVDVSKHEVGGRRVLPRWSSGRPIRRRRVLPFGPGLLLLGSRPATRRSLRPRVHRAPLMQGFLLILLLDRLLQPIAELALGWLSED